MLLRRRWQSELRANLPQMRESVAYRTGIQGVANFRIGVAIEEEVDVRAWAPELEYADLQKMLVAALESSSVEHCSHIRIRLEVVLFRELRHGV
jgi:hypothetical protein